MLSVIAMAPFAVCGAEKNANASLYKWVDDKGVTHYGDHLPP